MTDYKAKGRTLARQLLQGATLGWSDEIIDYPAALAAALLTDANFTDTLKDARNISRENLAKDWKDSPGVSFTANLAGGIPFALAAPLNSVRGGSLLRAMGEGIKGGAKYGAVAGAGSATTDPDKGLVDALMSRAGGGGIGAGIGGFLGGLGGAATRLLQPADDVDYKKLVKALSKQQPSKAEQFLAEQLGARPDLQAQLARAEIMNTSSLNTNIPLTLPEKIAQSASDPLLVQQGKLGSNPQTAGAMEALYAARNGTMNAAGQIENQLVKKAQELAPNVSNYDDAALALIDKAKQAGKSATQKLSAKAAPLYESAYSRFLDQNDPLLKDPIIQSAIKSMRSKPAFQYEIGDLPDHSVKTLDLAKRHLDDMIESAKRAGNRNEARIMTGAKDELVTALKSVSDEYGQALNVYSGNPELLQMREHIGNLANVDPLKTEQVGQALFRGRPQQAEVAAQALGPEGSKTAAAARIYDVMGQARGEPTTFANKIAPNADTMQMLQTYAGGNQLDETLNVINQAALGNKYRAGYGSPTEPKVEAGKAMDAASAAIDFKTGGATNVIRKILGSFGKSEQSDPKFYADLQRLFTTDEGMNVLRRISGQQQTAIAQQSPTQIQLMMNNPAMQKAATAIGAGAKTSAIGSLSATPPPQEPMRIQPQQPEIKPWEMDWGQQQQLKPWEMKW